MVAHINQEISPDPGSLLLVPPATTHPYHSSQINFGLSFAFSIEYLGIYR
ncbi:hypothetical protein SPLC1_S550580 [Arthrospira platensis C1]|nr:hypothetical protein SPLC1_S550580 [Arthrospira platensis C1]